MEVLLFTCLAAAWAVVGGFVAIKNRKRLNLALGFTAGIILGLVAFDLLPEIFRICNSQQLDVKWPMTALIVGFLSFHIIEKLILLHQGHEKSYGPHTHPYIGVAGAAALCGHSFLDGASIGLAFQVSSAVGVAVAVAVIGHRFADGFNTTNVMLLHKHSTARARKLLYVAAAMPILGGLSTLLFTLPESSLAIYLGFFAGFLLYIGASDILPQAHSKGPSVSIIGMTVLGVLFMLSITQLTGI